VNGLNAFKRQNRTTGARGLPSAALMSPISRGFVAKLESFVAQHGIPLVQFRKGERKDAVMAEHLRGFAREEGVVFVGKAQEKAPVFRTEKRRSPTTGRPYLWIVRSTAMVNHYYIYAVDCDFGPFFLKFCTYFPFNAKLCLNGHEYAKRQLTRQGIAFEALDNAFSVVPTPNACRRFAMGYRHRRSMPCCASGCVSFRTPFTAADRQAGYRFDLSVLQAEFSSSCSGNSQKASAQPICAGTLRPCPHAIPKQSLKAPPPINCAACACTA
jgi:hypothetical protein